MITTQEQAEKHAVHVHKKHKNVVVLPDGQIYAGSDEQVQVAIDSNDEVFVVKGDMKKIEKKRAKKTEDKTE